MTAGTRLPAADEPPHADEIEDADPQAVEEAVVRLAGAALAVDDVDEDDAVALAAHERRQEAVDGVEIGQREEGLAAEGLEAAAGVAGAVLEHEAAHAVGDARLELLEAGRLAADALARHEAGPLACRFERLEQLRNEGGIVLAVAVEGHDDRGARALARRCARRRSGRRTAHGVTTAQPRPRRLQSP